ncbi:hypothetical protein AB0I84_32820 [Streptomyces spectabilis]|uniref:hypothetical protein n=1 Tax=Streptomyces spectabilis TaxID=68270 RepID=UPI0034058DF7
MLNPYLVMGCGTGDFVTVTSNRRGVTDWLRRYFGLWWYAKTEAEPYGNRVHADVNTSALAELTEAAAAPGCQSTLYGATPITHRTTPTGDIIAVQRSAQLAYRYTPGGPLRVVGADPLPVARAAARLARERLRASLLSSGWSLLHASAVADWNGDAVLALGPDGAGKATTALTLTHSGAWDLISTSRLFVMPAREGVRVLPWPASTAIGVGYLQAAGLYESVAWQLQRGAELHPATDPRVSRALLDRRRLPVRDALGREAKPRFHPRMLPEHLALPIKARGRAMRLLFPTLDPDRGPDAHQGGRLVGMDDVVQPGRDRYPDIFGLLPTDTIAADDLAILALNRLPRHALTLGHDFPGNQELLTKVTTA